MRSRGFFKFWVWSVWGVFLSCSCPRAISWSVLIWENRSDVTTYVHMEGTSIQACPLPPTCLHSPVPTLTTAARPNPITPRRSPVGARLGFVSRPRFPTSHASEKRNQHPKISVTSSRPAKAPLACQSSLMVCWTSFYLSVISFGDVPETTISRDGLMIS